MILQFEPIADANFSETNEVDGIPYSHHEITLNTTADRNVERIGISKEQFSLIKKPSRALPGVVDLFSGHLLLKFVPCFDIGWSNFGMQGKIALTVVSFNKSDDICQILKPRYRRAEVTRQLDLDECSQIGYSGLGGEGHGHRQRKRPGPDRASAGQEVDLDVV
jgi:hypothetical protein